ncbi:MAG: HNH endonuclease family protein, partial [Akkermansiaceae bacterium]
KKGSQRFPRNAEVIATVVEKDFYNIKPRNRTYFLQRLENHNNKEPVQLDGNSDITIEHIFPQTPDAKWKDALNPEAYLALSETHLHTIGNLTLSGNNGSLGNKSFAEKKQMNHDAKEQGYAFSRLWLNRYLKDIDQWDLPAYEERSRLLSERVLEIWRYP